MVERKVKLLNNDVIEQVMSQPRACLCESCSQTQTPKVDFEPRLGLLRLHILVWKSGKVNRKEGEAAQQRRYRTGYPQSIYSPGPVALLSLPPV